MRMSHLLLLVGAGLALLPASASARSCRPVRDVLPTGTSTAWAVNVKARHTSCVIARSLPRRVILSFRYGGLNPDDYSMEALGLGAWSCREAGSGRWPVVCRSGKRRVSWSLAYQR